MEEEEVDEEVDEDDESDEDDERQKRRRRTSTMNHRKNGQMDKSKNWRRNIQMDLVISLCQNLRYGIEWMFIVIVIFTNVTVMNNNNWVIG